MSRVETSEQSGWSLEYGYNEDICVDFEASCSFTKAINSFMGGKLEIHTLKYGFVDLRSASKAVVRNKTLNSQWKFWLQNRSYQWIIGLGGRLDKAPLQRGANQFFSVEEKGGKQWSWNLQQDKNVKGNCELAGNRTSTKEKPKRSWFLNQWMGNMERVFTI